MESRKSFRVYILKSKQSRCLFGPEKVRSRLAKFKVHFDMWFTGADFAAIALQQLAGAIRRRQPSYSECFFFGWDV